MATAAAVPSAADRHASNKPPSSTIPSGEPTPAISPLMNFPPIPVNVERDETWVQQLQAEQNKRFEIQAQVMHEEYLANLADAGPFASPERRDELLRRFEERLDQIKQMQQEELDWHIETERQERLWSLGEQDPSWDGWNNVLAEQKSILAHIRREQTRSDPTTGIHHHPQSSMRDRIRETQIEGEDLQRRNEEWQRTEPQRIRDRQRWAEQTRQTNFNLGERRQRDLADAEVYAAEKRSRERRSEQLSYEARQGAAKLRGGASRVGLNVQVESVDEDTSSISESLFTTTTTSTATDTSPSSYSNERRSAATAPPYASDSRSVPSSGQAPPPSSSGRAGGPSNITSSHTATSPSSRTPISNTMSHAKIDDPSRTARWIPPEIAREPPRKGSTTMPPPDDVGARKEEAPPTRKASMLFGQSPRPSPSPTLEEPSHRHQAQQPRPNPSSQQAHATSSQPPSRAPNAPALRSQPLPQTHQQQQQQQPSPSRPEPASRHTSSSQSTSSPAFPSSFTDSKQRRDERGFSGTYSPTHASGSRTGPPPPPPPPTTPTTSGFRATPDAARPSPPPKTPPMSSSADEYRTKLRGEYVSQEAHRVEAERRRREEEANERRAEDARRRGAEKRRQEEMAREAERREAERKARKSSIPNLRSLPDRTVLDVWTAYESQWAAMASASQLRFRSIPWPVLSPVSSPEMLIPMQIALFILHPQHSQGKARKDRLRDALLRWHPDRFETKWLKKVVEEERESVQEGVGLVVRALNELMSVEGSFGA